jgi:hypothetical protein
MAHERWFKLVIVVVTLLAVVGLFAGTPMGRLVALKARLKLERLLFPALELKPNRAHIDAVLRAERLRGIAQTRSRYRTFYEQEVPPGLRRILHSARMAPDEVLLRWANGDWTVVFSPLVFEADESGRAYRMRPHIRSFWLKGHALKPGLPSFFFLPETPEVQAAVIAAQAEVMPESYQTTNSWGCRGPEPDTGAAVRVLVVGDSFMQGIFVPDDETPPEHLGRYLTHHCGATVSVLNTGHIGYSPEQYFHTLREYHDRFGPQLVVVSVCANDFGAVSSVLDGKGNWSEAAYWLGEIAQFCRTRQTPCVIAAAPLEVQILGHRQASHYPGRVADLWDGSGILFLDLADPFIDEHLRLMSERIRAGRRPPSSPLFNGHLHDDHFSPLGAALWGTVVGRRVAELLDFKEARRQEMLRMQESKK